MYSLTSSEGWLSANSLIVSNCDCLAVPSNAANAGRLATDPVEAFAAMTAAERAKAFTRAGAEALSLGADIGRAGMRGRVKQQHGMFIIVATREVSDVVVVECVQ